MSAAAPGSAGSGGGVLTLAEKISLIKSELALAPHLPMAAAISAANEQMGLAQGGPATGSLPAQVERLLSVLGLPR